MFQLRSRSHAERSEFACFYKMTSKIKCTSCNIVIDEMLAYMNNKLSIIDDESLVKICVSAFKSEEIKNSKSLLFESLPSELRKINRKRTGKENRDIMDIVALLKSTPTDKIPVFVARDLEKLPPITFDHLDVTKLLKDLTIMKSDIKVIQSSYAKRSDLDDIKTQIMTAKSLEPVYLQTKTFRDINVNTRRGGYLDTMDSGPIGLLTLDSSDCASSTIIDKSVCASDDKHKETNQSKVEGRCDSPTDTRPPAISGEATDRAQVTSQTPRHEQLAGCSATTSQHISRASSHSQNDNECMTTRTPTKRKTLADIVKTNLQSTSPTNQSGEDWQLVERKRRSKNLFSGKMGVANDSEGKFMAAESKVPIFITNVSKQTRMEDIVRYVYRITQENIVLEQINIKKQTEHNAYKFFVSKQKEAMYLDCNLWPKGIIFRRFRRYKYNPTNSTVSATPTTALSNTING